MTENKLHDTTTNEPIKMTKLEEIEAIKEYLSGYKLSRDLLELEKYEREFLRSRAFASERPGDLSMARAHV